MEKKFIKQQDMVKRVKRECKVMKSTGRFVAVFHTPHRTIQVPYMPDYKKDQMIIRLHVYMSICLSAQ